jgi:hypothetical protein
MPDSLRRLIRANVRGCRIMQQCDYFGYQ